MQTKYGIRTAYTLGAAMIAAALIYFFASGWEGLSRTAQITLSLLLTGGFYGAAYALAARPRTAWLSKIAAVTGCVAFGVSVMLLGRIYNSHADGYNLFLLWSVPALGFAIVTRYWPFKLIAYILIHITAYAYADTAPWLAQLEELRQWLLALGVIALANALLFVFIEIRSAPHHEPLLRTLSAIMAWAQLLLMTNSLMFDDVGVGMNLVFAIWACGFIVHALRHRSEGKRYLVIAAVFLALFAILKYAELTVHFWSSSLFGFGLIFVAGLLTATVWFIRFLNRWEERASREENASQAGKDESAAHADVNPGQLAGHDTEHPALPNTPSHPSSPRKLPMLAVQHVLWSLVSAVGVTIGLGSLTGLTYLVAEDAAPDVLAVVGFILVIAALWGGKRLPAPVRFTVTLIGALTGFAIIAGQASLLYACLYLVLTVYAWTRTEGRFAPAMFYGLAHVYAFQLGELTLPSPLSQGWNLLAVLLAVNGLVLALSYRLGKLSEARRRHMRHVAYVAILVLGFVLTMDESGSAIRTGIASVAYFLVLTAGLIRLASVLGRFYYRWGVAAWAIFLVAKYYETAWKLLHKSFSLALAGVLLLVLAMWLERRAGEQADAAEQPFMRLARKSIAVLLLLQALLLGGVVYMNETALASGTTITLKLAPLDPRSLLQGDYVQLRYDISSLPGSGYDREGDPRRGDKVRIVLAPDREGVYQFSRFYMKGETLAPQEVVLSGIYEYDNNVRYGIEHYFIPEGTGAKVEQSAKYAKVKVSRSGNGILVDLLTAPPSVAP